MTQEKRSPGGIILPPYFELPQQNTPPTFMPIHQKSSSGWREPHQKDARRLVRDYGAQAVIILFFRDNDFGTVVAGKDQKTNELAGRMARDLLQTIKTNTEKAPQKPEISK